MDQLKGRQCFYFLFYILFLDHLHRIIISFIIHHHISHLERQCNYSLFLMQSEAKSKSNSLNSHFSPLICISFILRTWFLKKLQAASFYICLKFTFLPHSVVFLPRTSTIKLGTLSAISNILSVHSELHSTTRV